MTILRAVLLLLVLHAPLALPAPADAPEEGEVSTCDDAGAWARLEAMRRAYKGTDGEADVEYLYELRRFVCAQIAKGQLTYKAAEPLFQAEKDRIVKEWRRASPPEPRPPT